MILGLQSGSLFQFAVVLFAPMMVWGHFAFLVFNKEKKAQVEPL